MKNIVYTNSQNVTIEISWEAYYKEIDMRKQERLKKKTSANKRQIRSKRLPMNGEPQIKKLGIPDSQLMSQRLPGFFGLFPFQGGIGFCIQMLREVQTIIFSYYERFRGIIIGRCLIKGAVKNIILKKDNNNGSKESSGLSRNTFLWDCGNPDGHTRGSFGRLVRRSPHSDHAVPRAAHRIIATVPRSRRLSDCLYLPKIRQKQQQRNGLNLLRGEQAG